MGVYISSLGRKKGFGMYVMSSRHFLLCELRNVECLPYESGLGWVLAFGVKLSYQFHQEGRVGRFWVVSDP